MGSLVTIMVQTPSSQSQSQAQRENQSRSLPVDLATPSLVQLPHSVLLSFLPLPSKPPFLPKITNSSTSSTPSCLPLQPYFLPCPPSLHCFHQILFHSCHRPMKFFFCPPSSSPSMSSLVYPPLPSVSLPYNAELRL